MSPRAFIASDSVLISGRVAAMLEHHLGAALTDFRQRFRGKDAELDDTLLALRTAAAMFTDSARGSANGTRGVPTPELGSGSLSMSVSDVSNLVDLEERSIRKAAIERRLRGRKVGGVWQFDPQDVAEWRATRARGA